MRENTKSETIMPVGRLNFVANEWFDEDNKPRDYNNVEIEYVNEATDHWNSSYMVSQRLTLTQVQSIIDFLQAFQERNKA